MNRRKFLAASSLVVFAVSAGKSFAQSPRESSLSFDALLSEAIQSDAFEPGRDNRERQAQELIELAQKSIARRPLSSKKISQRAQNLIIAAEVTSPERYEQKYRKPTWPGGQSGVTVGVGYDVGYVSNEWLNEDWSSVTLPAGQLTALEPACGVNGDAARLLLPSIHGVDIPWAIAEKQFLQFVLPRYIAETIGALPNSEDLPPDCLGALVSLVYNRGASFSRTTDRFREMRAIRRHVDDRKFDLIPAELRSMKRIWQGQNLPGLIYRRELEAKLFEEGLKT